MQEDQGSIRVRFCATGEEVSVDMRQLIDMIASGTATEDDQVKGTILTDGAWRKLAGMRIFYTIRRLPVPQGFANLGGLHSVDTESDAAPAMNLGISICLNIVSVLFILVGCSLLYSAFAIFAGTSRISFDLAYLWGLYPILVIAAGIALIARKSYGWWFVLIHVALLSVVFFFNLFTPDMDAPWQRGPTLVDITLFALSLGSVIVLLVGNPWLWRIRTFPYERCD